MKKEEAIKIMSECAKRYHDNLEGKNVLFLFGSPQCPEFFEVTFLPRNFQHLTGVELMGRITSSVDFYDRCRKERLNTSDFAMPPRGMAEVKLTVLPQLMSIHKSARMVGDYNNSKPVLYTEKLAGNITACMGFIHGNKYYMPNTALKNDIRDIVGQQKRVIATFRKSVKALTYAELCYAAKGIDLSVVPFPDVVTYRQEELGKDASTEKPSIRVQLQAFREVNSNDAPICSEEKHQTELNR